jgi:nucleoside-triphosphatase THEP1
MSYTANISTNILRDQEKQIDFIVTPNTKEIFERIFLHNHGASKSFNLIGNYGTGKSTFLWALEKNLNQEKLYFSNLESKQKVDGFEIIKIVGSNRPFSEAIGKSLKLKNISNEDVLDALNKKREKATKKNNGLVLLVDEFGKFLENASKNNSLDELYLLQQISEWTNDENFESYFIITLHQNFSSYGKNLSSQDKLEWEKVKGRFIDLIFNEPVEQLIFFASKKLNEFQVLPSDKENFFKLNELVERSKLVNHSNVRKDLSESLFPLDWLSTNVLVNSLQRYGQNERSLFSFLNDDSNYAIKKQGDGFYTVSKVFDYLVHTMPSEINSAENPHRPQWHSTFRSLERAELIFEDEYSLATEVIKTIGLVNIFSKAGGRFDRKFLENYFQLTRQEDVSEIIDRLLSASIIRFYKHSNKLNFLEGTDLDLEQELISISKEINPNFSISDEIRSLIDYPIELVKKYTFETGTPRFFEYRIVNINELKDVAPATGPIDGYINLIFEDVKLEKLKKLSKTKPGNIFVAYNNSAEIKEELFKIKQFDLLIEKYQEDKNALKLLNNERQFHLNRLKEIVGNKMFDKALNVWIHLGENEIISNKHQLYRWLAEICYKLYSEAPKLKNELINKEFLSAPINAARKNLIRALLENSTKENLGFEDSKFPPEKAIYISLLLRSGIHKKNNKLGYYELSKPTKSSDLFGLWDESDKFLHTSLSNKRNLKEFIDRLIQPPFKLKKGFIDFWLPIYLIAKQEDFALFHVDGGYIPFLDEDVLDLIHRKPESFLIKSYDVSGLKVNLLESYKEIVQNDSLTNKGVQSVFLSIFSNFLRFQRGLNNYSLRTNKLSNKAINLRQAIVDSKDPEDALFNLFPSALGYHSIAIKEDEKVLESYSNQIKEAIRELRNSYGELLNRIENTIKKSFYCKNEDFDDYKEEIISKLKDINPHTLGEMQRVFFKRLTSPLDDKASWLKSVADVALGKSIDDLIDEEETLLLNTIHDLSEGLLKANEIHSFNSVSNQEKLLSFRFFNESGESIEEKLIINAEESDSNLLNKIKIEVDSLISELESNKRKEVLIELLSKNMNV